MRTKIQSQEVFFTFAEHVTAVAFEASPKLVYVPYQALSSGIFVQCLALKLKTLFLYYYGNFKPIYRPL